MSAGATSTPPRPTRTSGVRIPTGKPAGKPAAKKAVRDGEVGPIRRWFVRIARLAALAVIFGAVPFMLCYPWGPRALWTVAIAALPLFIVAIGYYSWRHVCPLAQTAQVGRMLGIGGKRKTGKWLEANYALVQLGLLFVALVFRLLATNGDPLALGVFLVAVFVAALGVGLVYTGKTWCNFFCPVGVVERMYTEPQSLAPQANSQCQTCTACKKFCPDIDLEQGYWKDAELRSKSLAAYAFPGLVFGFYFYFFALTGKWAYYFSGAWTREPGAYKHMADPGFYFAQGVPKFVAAPLTLLAFATASAVVLMGLERWLFGRAQKTALTAATKAAGGKPVPAGAVDVLKLKTTARHRVQSLAAFLAFNAFYVFAGAPTLHKQMILYRVFQFLVVMLSTMFLVKRWRRREDEFVQEKFARGFLKRWEWTDEAPPSDLKDLYIIHTERQKQKAEKLRAFKDTLRDMLRDGVVDHGELALLGKLRSQLGITEQENDKVLQELGVEDKSLFDPSKNGAEKRLQLDGYRRGVERMIIAAAPQGGRLNPGDLEELRAEFKLSKEETEGLNAELRDRAGPIVARIRHELDELDLLAQRHDALGVDDGHSRSLEFMRFLVRWRQDERIERALGLLASLGGEAEVIQVREQLGARDPALRAQGAAAIIRCGDPVITERLSAIVTRRLATEPKKRQGDPPAPTAPVGPQTAAQDQPRVDALLALAKDASPFVRAAATFVLSRYDEGPALEQVRAGTADEAVIVRETAVRSLGVRGKLGRELMEKALADKDPVVHRAALRASSRTTAEIQLLPEGLMQSVAGSISGEFPRPPLATPGENTPPPMYATLDPRAAVESLTTLEKMMLLRNVDLFDDLMPDALLAITRIAQERRFLAGQVLCREGEVGTEAFILISGKVRIWLSRNGQTQVVNERGAGVCIGEMAVLDQAPRAANVTSIADVRALAIPGEDFRALTLERPELSRNIIAELTGRLRGMIAQQFGQAR